MNDKIISGEIEIFGDSALVNGEYFILKDNFGGAKDGDEVKIKDISKNNNIPNYAVIGFVGKIRESVENIIEGRFKEKSEGFGFIKILGQKKEIYVSKNNVGGAKNGDKVKAILGMLNGKEEALITEVIDKAKPIFIGKVLIKNDKSYIELENGEVFPLDGINGVKKGDVLSIFLEEGEDLNTKKVILKEVLGDKNDLGIQTVIIAARNGARIHFPQEVLDEANSLDGNIDDAEIKEREDLRYLFTVTIDGPTAKDKDDAVSFELLENGDALVYVSIADVSHYVKENFSIDNEALLRATSLYYGDKVTPMIPERLSNDICSLNPGVDKLTVTCEIYVNSDGTPDIEKSKVYNSVIESNNAVTYEEIDSIYKGEMLLGEELLAGGSVSKELIKLVNDGFKLSNKIGAEFNKNGKLGIDSTETKVILDDEKKPIGVEAYPKYDSNELIENFMVIANNVVPQVMQRKLNEIEGLETKTLSFVHRTHAEPIGNRIDDLKNILELLDIDFEFTNNGSKTFSKLLDFIKGDTKEKFLTKKITTTLEKAIYTDKREGHFGLALDYYSHFTSPIRRYSDLQIHRILKEILDGSFNIERYEHYLSILPKVVEHSSSQEDMSERNEADVNRYLGVELMKGEIGNTFGAYVDDIDGKQIRVVLDNTVSGIIDLSENKRYDSTKLYKGIFKITNNNSKEEIGLGDKVSVILEKADTETMQLYFKLKK